MHLDHERVFGLFQDVALCDCVLQVLVFVEIGLVQNFHCICLVFTLQSALEDLSKCSMPKDFFDVEGFESNAEKNAVIKKLNFFLPHLLHVVWLKLNSVLHLFHSLKILLEISLDLAGVSFFFLTWRTL